jgi:hypothetical protein
MCYIRARGDYIATVVGNNSIISVGEQNGGGGGGLKDTSDTTNIKRCKEN